MSTYSPSSLESVTRQLIRKYDHAFAIDRDGLVSMMLQQFDTPILAFREIIQNSVDEGAQNIDVRITQKSKQDKLIVSIEDDGKGMDRDGIQRYLTLFDSTKENVLKTIGEMGVGKIFAFALDPEYLILETGKGNTGHKIVIDREMSGKLYEIPPRKGTKVTVVMSSENPNADYSAIDRSIVDNCEYISPHLAVNDLPTNRPFDIKSNHKVVIEDETTHAVVALTGVTSYKLLKGGILLEKGMFLRRADTDPVNQPESPFDDLEILVDSYTFNQPISRNAVNRDENYQQVMRCLFSAKERLIKKIITTFKSTPDKKMFDEPVIRSYLHKVTADEKRIRDRTIKIFPTVDGRFISGEEIIHAGEREGTIYYSYRQANANEITYFTERGIPVLLESCNFIADVFGKGYGFGWQGVTEDLFIEGLTNGNRKYQETAHDHFFLRNLEDLVRRVTDVVSEKNHPPPSRGDNKLFSVGELIAVAGTRQNGQNNHGNGNPYNQSFNLEKLKRFHFYSFLNRNGQPKEDVMLHQFEDTVLININHHYVKAMLDLSEKDPILSTYYLLSEIVTSKELFPDADHKMVEDFIIQMGQNVLQKT